MVDDGAVSEPRPTGRPNARLFQTVKDMVWSMALVLAVVTLLVWLSRTPDADTVKAVDPAPMVAAALVSAPFPVEMPASTPGYVATSARYEPTEGSRPDVAWFVGWVTPETQYVQLAISASASPDFVVEQTARGRKGETVELAGRSWQRYETSERRSLVSVRDGITTVVSGTVAWPELERFAASLAPVAQP